MDEIWMTLYFGTRNIDDVISRFDILKDVNMNLRQWDDTIEFFKERRHRGHFTSPS